MQFFKDMDNKKKSAKIRQNEITGEQFYYHSLPKEFQIWHNGYYMSEKKTEIDNAVVADALLNGYMWMTIFDATKFAIPTIFLIIGIALKLRLSPDFFGLSLALIAFFPWIFFLAYHFIFYTKIRAQVVGPVTQKCSTYTAETFRRTFYAIFFSGIVAFLVVFSFLEEIALLVKQIIEFIIIHATSPVEKFLAQGLTYFYNLLVDIVNKQPTTTFEMIVTNVYISTALMSFVTLLAIYLFEKEEYKKRRTEVLKEVEDEESQTGYVADGALKILRDK